MSQQHITLYGRIPSKKNSKQIVCRGRYPMVLPSAAYQAWHTEQMMYLKGLGLSLVQEISSITIAIFAPDKRKSDLSNKAESIMDLLVDAGILEDDNWFVIPNLVLRFGGVDAGNPRAETIIEYGN